MDTAPNEQPKTQPETCPLCQSTGIPQPPSDPEQQAANPEIDDADVDLIWIACNKCDAWYHSACLMLVKDSMWRDTIPQEIVAEAEKSFGQEGPWANWVEWIGKWYCAPCLARSASPSNPRPPRHPLIATLKRHMITARDIEHASKSLKRPALYPPVSALKPLNKKARTSTSLRAASSVDSDTDVKAEKDRPQSHFPEAGSSAETASESQGRPKRNVAQIDYHNLNDSIPTPTKNWLELIGNPEKYGRTILDANYTALPGKVLTREWLESQTHPAQDTGNRISPIRFWGPDREPLIIRPEDGGFSSLGGHLPGKDLTVKDVARLVGPDRMVDVIDVSSQQSSQWPLQKWADYISSTSSSTHTRNPKVYNIISLEISGTELSKRVRPPRIVREIDWVDNFWHFGGSGGGKGKVRGKDKDPGKDKDKEGKIEEGSENTPASTPGPDHASVTDVGEKHVDAEKGTTKAPYPKVQLYCLMGMKGAWTDWHVDFAASSVYYTIHSGSKVFYFIRPTEANLKAYAEWSGSYEKQQDTWLGDMVDEVRKVVLHAGDTMIIPTGYIHAVYTPTDTIVFGGNFLHSYSIETQLRLRQIEIDTKVPQRFRFPFFDRLCWYVADKYCSELRSLRIYRPRSTSWPNPPHYRVLQGLLALSNFLITQMIILQNLETEDKRRKLIHDRIPGDVVKDAEGLAMELKWRVERELKGMGLLEDADVGLDDVKGRAGSGGRMTTMKEKGLGKNGSKVVTVFERKPASRTWKFDPPPWTEIKQPIQRETGIVRLPRPNVVPGSESASEEEAEVIATKVMQVRKRLREIDDGGLVEESQETTFVERQVIWGGRQKGGKVAGGGDVVSHA